MKATRSTTWVIWGALLLASCTRSYEDRTAAEKSEEAAAKRRALAALTPPASATPPPGFAGPLPSARGPSGSYACPMTARRMIARMSSCEFDMSRVTPEALCSKMDQATINFAASRNCQELRTMFGSDY